MTTVRGRDTDYFQRASRGWLATSGVLRLDEETEKPYLRFLARMFIVLTPQQYCRDIHTIPYKRKANQSETVRCKIDTEE